MRALILLPLLAMSACIIPTPAPGFGTACLAGELPENLYEYDGDNLLFEIEGTVITDGTGPMPETAMECYGTVHRVLQIEDDEGVVWSLGYGIEDALGDDTTPSMPVEPGQEVQLTYRTVQSFGSANGFVLEDEHGLVAALESGTWGPALEQGDVPGLTVTSGAQMTTVDSECGVEGHFAWSFAGDEVLEVQPYGERTLAIDGSDFTVIAVANLQWQGQVQCTDLAGTEIWAVFR
jgi:hypothetical protein